MKKENYGFMVLAPIIGVKISDIHTLAGTDDGRTMLAILLLIRSGMLFDDLSEAVQLEPRFVEGYIDELVLAGMLDRMEVRNVT